MNGDRMRESMTARLDQLRREYELGQTQLRELVERESAMRETLLRISGAILVLEEMLEGGGTAPADEQHPAGATLTVP